MDATRLLIGIPRSEYKRRVGRCNNHAHCRRSSLCKRYLPEAEVPEGERGGAPVLGEETWKSYFSHATSIPHPCSLIELPPCPYSLTNCSCMHTVSHETVLSPRRVWTDVRFGLRSWRFVCDYRGLRGELNPIHVNHISTMHQYRVT